MNAIDVTRDRVCVPSHLRLLGQLIETGVPVDLPDSVRKPYASPQFVPFGSISAAELQAFRARRNQSLGQHLFGEPGWDMLLELFVARQQERKLSMKSLTIASNVPQTTAGRYLAQLLDHGLAACVDDPADGRRKLIGITGEGYYKMGKLFDRTA